MKEKAACRLTLILTFVPSHPCLFALESHPDGPIVCPRRADDVCRFPCWKGGFVRASIPLPLLKMSLWHDMVCFVFVLLFIPTRCFISLRLMRFGTKSS